MNTEKEGVVTLTKAELIKALSCIEDNKELLCSFSPAENSNNYPGYISSINISFVCDEANVRLNIREIQTTSELDNAA